MLIGNEYKPNQIIFIIMIKTLLIRLCNFGLFLSTSFSNMIPLNENPNMLIKKTENKFK